jgi:hypothetical protein
MKGILCISALLLAQQLGAAPVLFVTVTPSSSNHGINKDFSHFVSLVSSHRADARRSPRGGDLYIRYDDGTLRNLTAEAGYGLTPGQEITVREANVHWDGQRAVFAMVVGGTGTNPPPVFYQLYEATGILQGQPLTITKVPGQPENANNIQPVYATDGSIIFASDLPPTLDPAHYPALDEYESSPTITGLWRIDADGSNLRILDHCPSGDFTPIIDSFGRVIFTRWDHLKRDQQHDLWIDQQLVWNPVTMSFDPTPEGSRSRGRTFTYASEDDNITWAPAQFGDEFFPENGRLHPPAANVSANPLALPHPYWDQDFVPGMRPHDFNFFTPWMMNEDGSDGEVLNHLGRHELFTFVPRSLTSLPDFSRSGTEVLSFHQIREDPNVPGRFYGVNAQEFGKHGAGRIIQLDAPPSLNPDNIPPTYVHLTPVQASHWAADTPGHVFRDPMIRQDGTLWAACSGNFAEVSATVPDPAPGTSTPYPLSSSYQFKIRQLVPNGEGYLEPGPALIPDIHKTISYTTNYFFPSRQSTYSGPMWELFPVEVVPRTPPVPTQEHLQAPEHAVLLNRLGSASAIEDLRDWLRSENKALIIVRDSTVRADRQQPFNLKVAWSTHQNTEVGQTPTEVGYLQLLIARYLRAYNHSSWNAPAPSSTSGRRPIARPVPDDLNPPIANPNAPKGSVRIGDDGSAAAFVPAGRALTWQLTAPDGTAIVRERYWVTMRAGEIRFCHGCHGPNTKDVHGNAPPVNESEALADLLDWWKASNGSSRVGDWGRYSSVLPRSE